MLKNVYSIKNLRKAREISTFGVAKALGITESLYRRREKQPQLLTIGQTETLANLFDISFSEMWEIIQIQIHG